MKIGDILIIISAVLVSLLIAFMTLSKDDDSEEFSFVVKQGPVVILEKTLNKDFTGNLEFEFSEKLGGLEIDKGQVKFSEMSKEVCPRQICSRLGWANRQGDILACLPNKLTVEVIHTEGEKNHGADTVSF